MRALYLFLGSMAVLVGSALACTKATPPPPPPETADEAGAAVNTAPAIDGKAIIAGACVSCHSADLIAQQRLSKEKWAATVKKMVGWGANLDGADTENLVTYLAATYGPDAGSWEPPPVTPEEAKKALERQDDGAYGGGNAEQGKPLFVEHCSGCHGADARGSIGLNLVERPILYRAGDLATLVKNGRGKMTPSRKLTDRQIADVLSYLRTLKLP